MIKVPVYNLAGETVRELELNEAVFGVKPKAALIHQVYTAQLANLRQPWADTKGRGEVRGGGKKPWKQKGTGRARHGSIRSPIWKGGGVTFGPLTARNYKQKINAKMNKLAVKMCLSDKASDAKLVVMADLPQDGKTKSISALRAQVPGQGHRAVILTADLNDSVIRATRNVPRTRVLEAREVSVADLMKNQYLIASEAAVETLVKRLSDK